MTLNIVTKHNNNVSVNVVNKPNTQSVSVIKPTPTPTINVIKPKSTPSLNVVVPKQTSTLNVTNKSITSRLNITNRLNVVGEPPSVPELKFKEVIERSLKAFGLSAVQSVFSLGLQSGEVGNQFLDIYEKALGREFKGSRKINDVIIGLTSQVLNGLEVDKQEILAPIYDDNPKLSSFNEYLSTMIQGGSSLVLAAGVWLATHNPKAAAAVLSGIESTDTYINARKHGKSPITSTALSTIVGVGTYQLELLGFDFLLGKRGAGIFKSTFGKGVVATGGEVVQELTQTYWQNLIAKIGYDKTQKIFEGTWETMVATLPSAGLASGSVQGVNIVRQKLIDWTGTDENTAEEVVNKMTELVKKEYNTLKEDQGGFVYVPGLENKDNSLLKPISQLAKEIEPLSINEASYPALLYLHNVVNNTYTKITSEELNILKDETGVISEPTSENNNIVDSIHLSPKSILTRTNSTVKEVTRA